MQPGIERNPIRSSSGAYAWYVVVVLTLCYMLSFIDRQILSLLVIPIQRDLGASDTRMGLLQGLAFAIFYALAGLPLGRIVDTRNRRNLVMAGVAVWSVLTSACSLARSFLSLFMARMGVGVGEAALNPAAFSIISDYFPPERLATATSVFYLGALIGSGLAFALGGTIVDAVTRIGSIDLPVLGSMASWRLTFLAVGAPGLLVAGLVATVREPMRRDLLRNRRGAIAKPAFRELVAEVRCRWQSVAGISCGMAFQAMCLYGFVAWAPTFFARVHGWSPGEAGRALGLITIIFGCAGMLVGGILSDRWQKEGMNDAPLRVAVLSAIGCGVLFGLAFSVDKPAWTLALIGPALFFNTLPMGASAAALQLIFPNQLRGLVSAIFLLILNLGGLSLGPLLPGLFTDYLFRNQRKVGASLALSIEIASFLMLAVFLASRHRYREHYLARLPALDAAL
jgi:MFS family permease